MEERKIIDSLKKLDDQEAREYISLLFEGYNSRKKDKTLFDEPVMIPKLIIETYYAFVKKTLFTNIIKNYKEKYIPERNLVNFERRYLYNENKLEEVHSPEEVKGLRAIYDYVLKKENLEDISIYTLSDIHEILFSFTPYPEFGGKYRTTVQYLPGSGLNLTQPDLIVHEMNLLREKVNCLVKDGIDLGKNINSEKIIKYIDRCVELKCELIKIHPFSDGNGRSIRAFINLLFRLANIPPIYIENKERNKYAEAMSFAIGENDYSKIKGFYYYKICDSIISLDVELNKNNNYKNLESTLSNKEVKDRLKK